MFKLREKLRESEKRHGLCGLSEPEKAIFAFIKEFDDSHTNSIVEHEYFKDLSLSTIKRAINSLESKNLIKRSKNKSKDRRVTILDIVV